MSDNDTPIDRAVELLVYAPIGLAMFAKDTVPTFLKMFVARGQTSATYTGVGVDRVERTITYRKMATYPFYLIVGLASSDILAGWWREVVFGLSMLVIFLAILIRLGVLKRPGLIIGAFAVFYACARSFSEFFREPDAQLGFLWGGATMGQLLSIPLFIAGVCFIVYAVKHPRAQTS